jgi:2-dehydro-3-deoxyphosphogluconate aldolase/(4S)-4-hydroxy-2-oxoglutarate aldolase
MWRLRCCAAASAASRFTLRTPAALAAIVAMARQVPEIARGAGTVISAADLQAAASAGATSAQDDRPAL